MPTSRFSKPLLESLAGSKILGVRAGSGHRYTGVCDENPDVRSRGSLGGARISPASKVAVFAALIAFVTPAAFPQAARLEGGLAVARAAAGQVGVTLVYDPSYRRLAYPGGDVPLERGVCADVVVRAFRAVGVDLQVALHEDMRRHFGEYPRLWGLRRPDPNIDHRRVPNLMTFFERRTKRLAAGSTYEPGDVVAWRLPNGLYHIGIVAEPGAPRGHHLMVHNIGQGARVEDVLYAFEELGHYRW